MELFVLATSLAILGPIVFGWVVLVLSPFLLPMIAFISLILLAFKADEAFELAEESSCVLVVDDEFQSVLPLIKLLEKAKVPFKYVQDGFEAITELRRRHFRLIVMDFYMPHLTGVETLVRADAIIDDAAPPTPVILYSGKNVGQNTPLSLKHLSIVDSWSKSMNLQSLWDRLDHLLVTNPS